jgi:hypothetical protein
VVYLIATDGKYIGFFPPGTLADQMVSLQPQLLVRAKAPSTQWRLPAGPDPQSSLQGGAAQPRGSLAAGVHKPGARRKKFTARKTNRGSFHRRKLRLERVACKPMRGTCHRHEIVKWRRIHDR